MSKAATKNAKRSERRARKRAEETSIESRPPEEPFTPPCMSPVGTPVAPGAPMRPSLRRSSGVCDQEFEALRAALREALGAYNSLGDACIVCTTCSETVRAMEAKTGAGEASDAAEDFVVVSAFEPFYF
jgi:hypothetical protein